MNPLETAAAVLAKASLYDPTFARPDAGVAVAWAEALGPVDKADALQAVADHYATQTRRVMPADVLAGVKRIRTERVTRDPEPVPDADPDDVPAYLAALRAGRARAGGGEKPRDVMQLLHRTGRRMPAIPASTRKDTES